METIEYYNVIDKRTWGDGPWRDEADKVQWADPETGLPCIIVRGPSGSFCGYVGVPPGHPAHGLHYDGTSTEDAKRRRALFKSDTTAWVDAGKPPMREWLKLKSLHAEPYVEPVRSEAGEAVYDIEVHGGLTYAEACADTSREAYDKCVDYAAEIEERAKRQPQGDAAEWLDAWGQVLFDYEAWLERAYARFICHRPEAGEPEPVWWFGFDCAHVGDIMPKMEATLASIGQKFPRSTTHDEVYRTVPYVREQCAILARQLAAIVEG